jgi:putative ABC transport system permease protein
MPANPAEYVELSIWQVGMAAALILVCGLISLALRLGIGRRLLLAAVRTVVQLLAIGLVLKWIFTTAHWYYVVALMAAMTFIAGLSAIRRTGRRYRGMWLDSLAAMGFSSWLMTSLAVVVIIGVPWSKAQYTIPLLGMILGNTLNGISLAVDRLGEELTHKRDQVETLLALGATRWESARGAIQESVRTGMTPTINAMMVVGLVSLPGMMTGQMLGGVSPVQAVMYQIVIMFLICAGTSLGTLLIVLLGYRRLFTAGHQFLPARLVKRPNT